MSRSKVIGLMVGVLLTGLLLVGVLVLVAPAPSVTGSESTQGEIDIRGNWGPNTVDCTVGKRLIVADGSISAAGGTDQKPVTLGFDIEFFKVPEAIGPVLVLHPWHEPPQILMLVHTDLSEGKLRFIAAQWSESTKAAYGDQMKALMPLSEFLGNLQRGAPYHRCP